MSEENVEIVKAMYEAFAQGGVDPCAEYWTDDLDISHEEYGVDEHPVRGKDAFRAWLREWLDSFDEFWFEPVELIDALEAAGLRE
jgi:ketosteroid isomerase-like protein